MASTARFILSLVTLMLALQAPVQAWSAGGWQPSSIALPRHSHHTWQQAHPSAAPLLWADLWNAQEHDDSHEEDLDETAGQSKTSPTVHAIHGEQSWLWQFAGNLSDAATKPVSGLSVLHAKAPIFLRNCNFRI